MSVTWRKSKSGEWVVCGPVHAVHVGVVAVTKRSGAVEHVEIERLGKPFQTDDGITLVYGYPAKAERTTTQSSYSSSCENCGEGKARYPAVDSSGIRGKVCQRCSSLPSYELSFC